MTGSTATSSRKNPPFSFSSLTLFQKGIILLGLPVILQSLTLAFFFFDKVGDTIAIKAGFSRNRSHAIRGINLHAIALMVEAEKCADLTRRPDVRMGNNVQEINSRISNLHLNDSTPAEEDAILRKLMGLISAVFDLLNQNYAEATSTTRTPEEFREHWRKTREQFSKYQTEVVSTLFELDDPKLRPDISPSSEQFVHRRQIRQLAIGFTFLNLVLLIVLAFNYLRGTAKKLESVEDHCDRISRGKTDYVPLSGSDEISRLDQTLHELAVSLADAASKQRSFFDNSQDVLCYLTEDTFCFTSINNAASTVFQLAPNHLEKASVETVIHPDDRELMRKNLQEIVNARSKPPFEMCAVEGAPFIVRISRRDGSIAHTVWTVQYIPSSRTLFCVVHDFTDQIAAQNARKEIAQMVNHDLRSPLNAIRVIYSIFEAAAPLNENGRASLATATANTDRMLRLINELLDFEKIEAGLLTLEKEPFPIQSAFQSSLEAVQAMAQPKQLQLQIVPTKLEVDADMHRVIQVLINLLSNAIKFSPKGGVIQMAAQERDGMIEVSVADNGRGIPKDVAPHIFDRFRQVERADATSKGGTGLGLAICKSLVELHGGTIWVTSEVGKGSVFYFRLPRVSP